MKLKVKILKIDTFVEPFCYLNKETSRELGVHSLERVVISKRKERVSGIVNICDENIVRSNEIGISESLRKLLNLKSGEVVNVERREELLSKLYIKKRIEGKELKKDEIYQIVKDIVTRKISTLRLSALVTAYQIYGMSIKEAAYFSMAMADVGEKLKLNGKILDKHSLGGIPGDKTSLILVPTVAALGYTIPKTSSRAITDPAGTADRAEVLMHVDLKIEKIKKIVKRVKGCIVWGGALNLAPADDVIISAERPLSLDSFLIPSILAKKYAVGAKFLVLDFPVGKHTKLKNMNKAKALFERFKMIGKMLNMKINAVVTNGSQPLGTTVGPALEVREVLEVLEKKDTNADFVRKACFMTAVLLNMVGNMNIEDGIEKAKKCIKNGKSEKKLREIIKAQGGNPKIKSKDIEIGAFSFTVKARKNGYVTRINNDSIKVLGRSAGAPLDKGAGILLHKKIGDPVEKGEKLFEIYAETKSKLKECIKLTKHLEVYTISSYKPKVKDIILGWLR